MRIKPVNPSPLAAYTLIESVISLAIVGLVFSGVLLAYMQTSLYVEWSGYELAAQAMATRQLELVRAATWDTQTTPVLDQTTNVPTNIVWILDIPVSGTNVVWATNNLTVTPVQVSTNPVVYVKMITIKTTYTWQNTQFTNTTVDYRAPDQ